jgi:putative membrane protein
VAYAGVGAVARAIENLGVTGLLLLVLLHLPVGVLMGLAWRLASGDHPPVSRTRFVWARFLRDGAAEALPFSQLGGFVLGLRALGRDRAIAGPGVVSLSIDLVIELTAKLPYIVAGLLSLLVLAPNSGLTGPLSVALGVTGAAVLIVPFAGRWLGVSLESMARAISRRWPILGSLDDPSIGQDVRASYDRFLSQRWRLWLNFSLHTFCWFFGALEVWLAFRLLGVHLTLLQALAIDSTVAALRTFGFMVPAAAGVQEASYLLGAGVFGIPPALAIAASLARRARDLALGIAVLAIAVARDPNFALLPALKSALQSRRQH